MKKLALVILTLTTLLTSCQETPKTIHISPELREITYDYMRLLKNNGIEYNQTNFIVVLDIDLVGLPIAGYAHGMDNDSIVYVSINPATWNRLTKTQKKLLIFHELTHDIFNVRHDSGIELMKPQLQNVIEAEALSIDEVLNELIRHLKNG